MKLCNPCRTFFIAVLSLLAAPCVADDYASGYSLVPLTVIGGVDGGSSSPAKDGHNITLPARGAEAIRMACLKQGQLWIFGDPQPRTCFKVTEEASVLLLWLAPAVKPPAEGVRSPPALLSATPFPKQPTYKERATSPEESAALRAALAKLGTKGVDPSAKMSAIDIPERGVAYYLVPGRHLLDTNEEEYCATTATLVYVKDVHGLNYSGELEAHPLSFVQRTAGVLPDAIVTKDCGKQMSLWQVTPKTRALISYSNGYEYGG